MKAMLALLILTASLAGCAVVPLGYYDGGYHGYYGDRHYRSDRYDRGYYHRDRWYWRYDDRARYDSGSIDYRNWDHGR
ncbi:MAG TPA: hypothetical protein VF059_05565 [Casimicrobiaceae bacterium]